VSSVSLIVVFEILFSIDILNSEILGSLELLLGSLLLFSGVEGDPQLFFTDGGDGVFSLFSVICWCEVVFLSLLKNAFADFEKCNRFTECCCVRCNGGVVFRSFG
jgi:hypothetical protein